MRSENAEQKLHQFGFFALIVFCALCFLAYTYAGKSGAPVNTLAQLNSGVVCGTVQDFPGTIILGRPTGNEITFSLLSSVDIAEMYVTAESQVAPAAQTSVFSLGAGSPTTITLSGLYPNSYYYYTAIMNFGGTSVCSTMHGFQTQRSPGSSFTFAIIADTHLGNDFLCNQDRYKQTLQNINDERPDFTISIGDDFLADLPWVKGTSEVQKIYLSQRPFLAMVGQDGAVFNINGNHELQNGWLLDGTDRNMAIMVMKARLAYYPNPRPNNFYSGASTPQPLLPGELTENYYAWFWGDALFVTLDDYLYSSEGKQWSYSLGYDQFTWLKSVLPYNAGFKFVFHHTYGVDRGGVETASYFEWGGLGLKSYEFTKMRPGWGDQPIHQILVANQVDVVFKGHDHLYVKQDHPDGIIYVTAPQAAFDPDGWKGGSNDKTSEYTAGGTILGPAGHLSVEVTPDAAIVSYIFSRIATDSLKNGVNGQVADQFTVPRKMRYG